MRGLRLLEEERRGVRGAWKMGKKETNSVPQAVGKLFSGKIGNAEGMVQALGRIWCPRAGICCKVLGDNLFLFSFLQPGVKRRAFVEGPWEFGGDLLIVVDFEETKRLKNLEFIHFSVWIRVADLPLGLMNEETLMLIGNKVGKALEVDADEDGSAVGGYLRIKTQLDVRRLLARGVLVEDLENECEIWCNFQYEFLLTFCYICGCLGHVDKECDSCEGVDSSKQYGEWLRVNPGKKRFAGEQRSRWSGGNVSGGLSNQQRSEGRWRPAKKEKSKLSNATYGQSDRTDPELRVDSQNPLKTVERGDGGGIPLKLSFGADDEGANPSSTLSQANKVALAYSGEGNGKEKQDDSSLYELVAGTHSAMHGDHVGGLKDNGGMEIDADGDQQR
ncbi:hypothetical protein E2562_017688 [Oryza meyeriana var. granulata]|uniref:CCHC-type domain-containing protein n=1 Tax=Oryza meyeriana var. granulata TaxID=110450 RepID=A0A6G1BYD5_9ORYZ|nr:hypothetical protein E2562_017688 [Oryza meyeriana var. granulata]